MTSLQNSVHNHQCAGNSLGYMPCRCCKEDESSVRCFIDRSEKTRVFIDARTGVASRQIFLAEASAEAAQVGQIPPACAAEPALGIS